MSQQLAFVTETTEKQAVIEGYTPCASHPDRWAVEVWKMGAFWLGWCASCVKSCVEKKR